MNGTDCLLAFAALDETRVAAAQDAETVRRSFRRQKKRRVALAGVCGCMTALLLTVALGRGRRFWRLPAVLIAQTTREQSPEATGTTVASPQTQNAQTASAPSTTQAGTEAGATQAAELWQIPRWDERAPQEQYTSLECGGVSYRVGRSAIDEACLGERLGSAELSGYDEYTEQTYRLTLPAYRLRGVSSACAVGVRLENGLCFPYVNAAYAPETLFQFLADLDLKNGLRFGSASMEYFDDAGQYHALTFADFDDAAVWDRLLAEDAPMQTTDTPPTWRKLCDIAVAAPTLGYTNQALWLTEDGWVVTNLLETAKAFYIGPDRAKAFADFLFENVPHTEAAAPAADATGIPE